MPSSTSLVEYPHPLDYATGLKYALTRGKVETFFKPSPENFEVEELVDFDKLGFNKEKGEYAVLRIVKRSEETFKVLDLLKRLLGIPTSNIHILGLKDKNALTTSYAFIRLHLLDENALPVVKNDVTIELVGYVKKKPTRSHHLGNRFRVFIQNVTSRDMDVVKEVLEVAARFGLISYYGYQRFGFRRYNSHLLGKLALLGREDLFAYHMVRAVYPLESYELVLKRFAGDISTLLYEREYVEAPPHKALARVLEKTRGIYFDAYASYLYNLLLNKLIEERGVQSLIDTLLPLAGCPDSTNYYKHIAELEGVSCDLLKQLPCSERPALFKTRNVRLEISKDTLEVMFTLEPGMYASVVLRELFKENLLMPGNESNE